MSPTLAMTDIITQILVEVLKIFGIATKELKRGSASGFSDWLFVCVTNPHSKRRAEKFLRKLAGMAGLEDALKKLDRLTQEEARMASAEVLRLAHSIRDGVGIVDGKVEEVGDKVQVVIDGARTLSRQLKTFLICLLSDGKDARVVAKEISGKVADVGGKVQSVDERVQVIIDGAQRLFSQPLKLPNIYAFRKQASKSRGTGNKIGHSTGCQRHR